MVVQVQQPQATAMAEVSSVTAEVEAATAHLTVTGHVPEQAQVDTQATVLKVLHLVELVPRLAVAVQRKAQGAQLAPLLQDDPTTVARRQRLERSLVNLSAAWDELNNVV